MARVIRREWFCKISYLVQKNLWRTNVLNARWALRDREGLFSRGLWVLQIHHECSGRRIFLPRVGGLVRLHIAMGVFSEECFPCLGPTTVLVVVPEARLHILFTPRKRRKNEEIEAHSLHTSSPSRCRSFPPRMALNFSAEQIRQSVFLGSGVFT